MTILDAVSDRRLALAAHCDRESFDGWRVFLEAAFGLPVSDQALFTRCTGRHDSPTRAREVWAVVGRRGGKSRVSALVSVYLGAILPTIEPLKRSAGERLVIPIIAVDRKQARIIYRYTLGLLKSSPLLASLIENETAECITLTTGVDIEILTCSSKQTRGYTAVAVILDEVCFYRSDDSADPDAELVNALLPTMATQPNAMLVAVSSPYAKRGVAWQRYQRYYGKPGDVLVWQAPTRVMNPTVPQSVIDRAMEEDPAAARAEYMAEWRDDIASFVSRDAIAVCVDHRVMERPPRLGVRYFAHVDPSGGSSDSMTLAIAHVGDDGIPTLDALREVTPPFSPRGVVAAFATTLAQYGLTSLSGDRYAGEWPRELVREHGIDYEVSSRSASEGYLALLPLLNSVRVRLLDNPRLITQLASLERRTSGAGRDLVSHPRNSHDDVANAATLALLAAADGARVSMGEVSALNLARTPIRHGLGRDDDAGALEVPGWADDEPTASRLTRGAFH